MDRLDSAALVAALEKLPGWTYDAARKALFQRLERRDFAEAFGLMAQIAIVAEKRDHHPEWSNVYNRVDIWLTTHDADGVSRRDVALAEEINRIVGARPVAAGQAPPTRCR